MQRSLQVVHALYHIPLRQCYDNLVIPRVKGKRREIRRLLAQRSKELLHRYRRGETAMEQCPLKTALNEAIS
jgi:hypothetical protein